MSFLGELVTATQAASHVGVGRTTIYSWQRKNLLRPKGYDGRQWLYLMHDVVRVAETVAREQPQRSHRKERAVPGFAEVA